MVRQHDEEGGRRPGHPCASRAQRSTHRCVLYLPVLSAEDLLEREKPTRLGGDLKVGGAHAVVINTTQPAEETDMRIARQVVENMDDGVIYLLLLPCASSQGAERDHAPAVTRPCAAHDWKIAQRTRSTEYCPAKDPTMWWRACRKVTGASFHPFLTPGSRAAPVLRAQCGGRSRCHVLLAGR